MCHVAVGHVQRAIEEASIGGDPDQLREAQQLLTRVEQLHEEDRRRRHESDVIEGPDERRIEQMAVRLSEALAAEIEAATGDKRSPVEVADGFLKIAVDNMANAIKQISVQRGYDVTDYTLNCFGGAGGQHACLVADALGMTRVFVHPFAGVLSAYGMGLAEQRIIHERAVEKTLDDALVGELKTSVDELAADGSREMESQGVAADEISFIAKAHLRYEGTDTALVVDFGPRDEMLKTFEEAHMQQFGFIAPEKGNIVEAITVEVVGGGQDVGGGGAADIVFGRLAAEEHDEMDAFATGHTPTVPVGFTQPRVWTTAPDALR